jgi:4'-phosphopantetheinyl transferase
MQVAEVIRPIVRNLGVEACPPADLPSALDQSAVVVLVARTYLDLPPRGSDLRCLSAAERAHAEMISAQIARRFAYARRLVRESIASVTARDPATIPIRRNEHGKPVIDVRPGDCPTHFSIAHSGDCVAVALSRRAPVGVDIERIRPVARWEDVAERVLTKSEQVDLHGAIARGAEPATALLRHWCKVEAAYKAVGTGLPTITSSPTNSRPEFVTVIGLQEGSATPSDASLDSGYCGAVAVVYDRNEIIRT